MNTPRRTFLTLAALAVTAVASSESHAAAAPARWSPERAWQWYQQHPWLVGFNYVPSTACNTTEWWQAGDLRPGHHRPRTRLGATKLGFNTTRGFIQYLVWKHDPDGFKKRFATFLAVGGQAWHHASCPSCSTIVRSAIRRYSIPCLGRQRDPIPGMILPSWTPSPGRKLAADPAERPRAESVRAGHGADVRPGPPRDRVGPVQRTHERGRDGQAGMAAGDFRLGARGRAATAADHGRLERQPRDQPRHARRIRRDQLPPVRQLHRACGTAIADLKKLERPVICTEWMARLQGSRWDTDLPLFKAEGVGCYNWGLVNGRTQCQFAWYHKRGTAEPTVWFHDLFHADGRPYEASEHDRHPSDARPTSGSIGRPPTIGRCAAPARRRMYRRSRGCSSATPPGMGGRSPRTRRVLDFGGRYLHVLLDGTGRRQVAAEGLGHRHRRKPRPRQLEEGRRDPAAAGVREERPGQRQGHPARRQGPPLLQHLRQRPERRPVPRRVRRRPELHPRSEQSRSCGRPAIGTPAARSTATPSSTTAG